jgi:hypothetical protein
MNEYCDLTQFLVLKIRAQPDFKLLSTLFRHPDFYVEVGVTKKKTVVPYAVFCCFQSKSAA